MPDHYDKEASHETQHEASPHDDQKYVDETEHVQQPEVHPEQPQDDEAAAADATFIPQVVDDTAYHYISGETSQALEEEGDYEGTNTSTEYQEDGEGALDAAAVHETADTDAATFVSNENAQFGGEETEYLDYVQPEEYDERYGEDFSEELEYDQTVGCGESGEHDASVAVDESQAVLPGSDLYEAETTPVPAQSVDSTLAHRLESADSNPHGEQSHLSNIIVSHPALEQGDRLPPYESFETKISQHTNKSLSEYFATLYCVLIRFRSVLIVDQQADQHESIQLPTDESDSNFLAMLEREAGESSGFLLIGLRSSIA